MSDAFAANVPADPSSLKGAMKAMWMAGDFGKLAARMTEPAEAFVGKLSIVPGSRVLDVACGTGNSAIPAARLGAIVTGIDIAPNLLEQARARAAEEHLSVQFDEGDAEQLPYPDGTFDVVQSMFGAMFAPRPGQVAKEAARVLKPGGLLAMANWDPLSFSATMFKASARHVPPPPGIEPPVLWGSEATVQQRLEPYFQNIQTEIVPTDFDMPMNPAGCVSFFRSFFGPTVVAFSRLDDSGKAALEKDLVAIWAAANIAPDPDEHTVIHNQYLLVRASRKAEIRN